MRASRFILVHAFLWLHMNHYAGLVPEELHGFYTFLTARGQNAWTRIAAKQVHVKLLVALQSTGAWLFLQTLNFGLFIWDEGGQKNLDLPYSFFCMHHAHV